ncbi:NEAT domain-containing protein [Mammaliicoccus sciuri]|uniref:NEAT domain-containing protein n=1 Tax=Mammaliicoccus sciuri TaxID=1296 RepID=UPI001FB1A3F7|nr:NEAT domain-containing protein [Mammaliicoccus sciuri]MCJ1778010.1 NEAT domain-containing protein [Mammaliicoccus sciuri]
MTTQHEHNKNRSTIKKQHHFSIRKLSGGIASIAIGATLFLGAGQTANAMEDKVDTVNEATTATDDSQSEPVATDDATATETAEAPEAPAAENVDNEATPNTNVAEENKVTEAEDTNSAPASEETPASNKETSVSKDEETLTSSKESNESEDKVATEETATAQPTRSTATTEATTYKEESAVSEENEAHDFGFIVKKEAEDAKSVMDDYLEHPSKLSQENGKNYLNFTLLHPSWWKMFELYNGDEKLNMTTLEDNDEKRVVKVEVPSGVSELTSKVHIVVPFINYDNKYTTRVIFDEAVPEAPKTDVEAPKAEPETPKADAETPKAEPEAPKADTETPKADAETPKAETPSEDKVSADNEGQDFGFVVKKEQKDATSVSDLYVEHPAKIIHKNGKTFVNFTLKRPEFWQKFELYNGDEKLNTTIIEDTEEKRVVQVEVPTGVSTLISKLHIYIPYGDTYDYDLTTRVVFDKAIPDGSQVVPEAPKTDAEAPKTDVEAPKAEPEAPKTDAEAPKSDAETPKADQEQTSKLREDVKNKEIHNKQVDGEKRPINFKVINPKDNSEIFYYAAMIKDPANIVFDGDQPILELRVDAPSTWVEFDLFDGDKKLDYDVVSFDPENEVATIRVKVSENTKELKVKGTSLIFGEKSERELGHIVFDKPITKDASNYATADDYKKQKDREKYDKAITLEDKVRELEKLIDKVSDDEKPQLQEELKGLKDKLAKELETAVTEFEKAPVTNVDISNAKDRNFKVLHSSKDDQSHMDFEVEHPAKLVEYNGKKMLAVTLKHDSMWKDFQVEGEDGYKRPITISKDSEKDTRTILFPVVEGKDFYNAIIKIHLITPHVDYEGSYHVRIKDLGDAAETPAPEPTPSTEPAPTPSPAPDNKQEPTKDQPSTATPDQKQEPAKDQQQPATPDQKQEPTKDQQPTVKLDQKAEPVVNVSTKPTTEPEKDQVKTNKEEQKSVEPVASKDKVEPTKQEASKEKVTTEQPKEQAKKQENKNELPNTGELDNTQYALFGSLIAGLGSLFFISRRKTKNSK